MPETRLHEWARALVEVDDHMLRLTAVVQPERAFEEPLHVEVRRHSEGGTADVLGASEALDRVDMRLREGVAVEPATDDVQPVLIEDEGVWFECARTRALGRRPILVVEAPPSNHAGEQRVEYVLLASVELRSTVGHIEEPRAEVLQVILLILRQ